MKAKAAVLFLGLSALLAWTSIGPAIAQTPQICPQIYMPVCGVVPASGIETYPNSCEADRAGATILHDGKCQGAGQKRCTHIFKPVCAKSFLSGIQKTYDSLCWAEKNWAVLVHEGAC